MNLSYEEKVLIKDIFNVRVSRQQGQYSYKFRDSESMILLQNFINEFGVLGPNASLVQNSTYYDSLLMEILEKPGTDILSYLQSCINRCNYVIEKPWNQNNLAQNFIKYSEEIIKNFIYLSQTVHQIFPNQLEIDVDASKIPDITLSVAMRLMSFFERNGLNMEIFNVFYPKIDEENGGDFAQSFIEVLVARQRCQNIFDAKTFFYVNTLESLMGIPELKAKFMNLEKAPFLPVQFTKIQGSVLDKQTPLGVFLRMSILGHNPGPFYQQNEAIRRYNQKVIGELGHQKFGKDKVKYYTDLQNEYFNKFTNIYKVFLKKQSQKQFLQWNYAAILGNIGRTKLSSRLQSARNLNLSHDGFSINLYVALLNLCKPFFNLDSGKHESINPEYFVFNERVKLCKYDAFNKKQVFTQKKHVQFGTITEFFFLAWEMLAVGLIPTYQTFIEDMNQKQKLQKMKDKFPHGHPMKQRVQEELARLKSRVHLMYIILLQQNLINHTIKLFDLFIFKLPNWLGISYDDLQDCKFNRKLIPNDLIYHLPEHLLDSICKFHSGVFRSKNNYVASVGEPHVHEILKLTCLILSEENIVSNPYIGANFIEVIFLFLLDNKVGIMYQAFKNNTVCQKNLTLALMRFYCDIAVTGSSHAFYEKFKYRQYVNRILTALWAHQAYRENLKSYFKTSVFERFLNMVMGDATYCFDEANEKYKTYKELQNKSQTQKLTEEQERNEEQLSSQIQSTISHSTSNIKLLKQLSKWSPSTFFSQAFLGDIVRLLNSILSTFIDPTSFVANRQLVAKFRFEKDLVLSHIVQIYVNLNVQKQNIQISEKFASEIVKDTRNFKKENFGKALQRASNEHQTDIVDLQKFQQLIGQLHASVDDEQDEEIYGQIPDKYLCSLMSTLMKEPVELKSGYVVDRVYIHKHVLNDERDPFTRAPLKNGEWKERKDLKEQIDGWKKKRIDELKGGNKTLKYGKIGQNKKDEEQDSKLFGGKVLKYEDQEQNDN